MTHRHEHFARRRTGTRPSSRHRRDMEYRLNGDRDGDRAPRVSADSVNNGTNYLI